MVKIAQQNQGAYGKKTYNLAGDYDFQWSFYNQFQDYVYERIKNPFEMTTYYI